MVEKCTPRIIRYKTNKNLVKKCVSCINTYNQANKNNLVEKCLSHTFKYITNNNALVAKCSSHAFIDVYNKKLVKKYIYTCVHITKQQIIIGLRNAYCINLTI